MSIEKLGQYFVAVEDPRDHPPIWWTQVTAYAAAASCSLLAGVM